MSEEIESGPSETGDPVAVSLALAGASRAKADAFLDEQRHHLREQLVHLRLGIWEMRMGVLLRVATAFAGFAFAAAIALMIWNAADSNRLIVDAFSVPPALAQKGMTGEVLAGDIVGRLTDMQAQTNSIRAPQSYANSFGDGVRLEIPETGISLSELDRFLRDKLGHDTHVSGAVIQTPSGLKLMAHMGAAGSANVSGADSDLDTLVQRASESIYGRTQPYRYAFYLATHGHRAEAKAIFEDLAKNGSKEDRSWGYLGWGLILEDTDGFSSERHFLSLARVLNPNQLLGLNIIAQGEEEIGRREQALRDGKTVLAILSGGGQQLLRAQAIPVMAEAEQGTLSALGGDFHRAVLLYENVVGSPVAGGRFNRSANLAQAQAGDHDLAAARATLADPVPEPVLTPGGDALRLAMPRMRIATEAEDWKDVLLQANAILPLLRQYPGQESFRLSAVTPLTAYAQARLGNMPGAEVLIAATPADCYDCLIARARIAALRGQQARADWWFARATAAAPSLPFAHAEWGQALLVRGQPDAAIERFKLANRRGPHFADPLVWWGEALMAKNQSHLALAKFQEAEKYAPNWGRLHLKWGEALAYSGKRDDARAQFTRAAALDLTPSEKSELARMSHV